jgi:hypothetical protein
LFHPLFVWLIGRFIGLAMKKGTANGSQTMSRLFVWLFIVSALSSICFYLSRSLLRLRLLIFSHVMLANPGPVAV